LPFSGTRYAVGVENSRTRERYSPAVPPLDVVDEHFVMADPSVVRRELCDEQEWARWLPGLRLECYDDRGDLGKRWDCSGLFAGTAEVWLEASGDGTLVHVYLCGTELPARRRRRLVRTLKRQVFAVKDRLEAGRPAGLPDPPSAVPLAGQPGTAGASVVSAPMADQTTSDITVDADAASVMAIIADFSSYPEWATGVKQAEVLEDGSDGRPAQVRFLLDAAPIKDEYTLAYEWDADRQVTWTLVKGKVLKGMDGAYVLDQAADGETTVTYRLAVDVSIPMIGMLRRKAEKVIIDAALKGLKKRVESA